MTSINIAIRRGNMTKLLVNFAKIANVTIMERVYSNSTVSVTTVQIIKETSSKPPTSTPNTNTDINPITKALGGPVFMPIAVTALSICAMLTCLLIYYYQTKTKSYHETIAQFREWIVDERASEFETRNSKPNSTGNKGARVGSVNFDNSYTSDYDTDTIGENPYPGLDRRQEKVKLKDGQIQPVRDVEPLTVRFENNYFSDSNPDSVSGNNPSHPTIVGFYREESHSIAL